MQQRRLSTPVRGRFFGVVDAQDEDTARSPCEQSVEQRGPRAAAPQLRRR